MKLTIIIGISILMILAIGCNYIDYCDIHSSSNNEYAYEKGNDACSYCFDTSMKSVYGGCAWSEITCEGEHNKLIMWSNDKFNEVNCHNPEYDCEAETHYLFHSTLWDYNCSKIKIMIDSDSYINIVETHHSLECYSNNSYHTSSSDTAGCKECAKDTWVRKYLEEC